MIERTFGNFEGRVDVARDEMHIRGLNYGWKATYSLDELPSKIAFYDRLIAAQIKRGSEVSAGFENTKKCLQWGRRILADG